MRFSNAPLLLCVLASAASMLGCPPGTKTSVDFTVQVTADGCVEDKQYVDAENVAVDCQVEAGGTVKVQFPRRQWWEIRAARHGSVDVGPGK